jgi:hypothetical protein
MTTRLRGLNREIENPTSPAKILIIGSGHLDRISNANDIGDWQRVGRSSFCGTFGSPGYAAGPSFLLAHLSSTATERITVVDGVDRRLGDSSADGRAWLVVAGRCVSAPARRRPADRRRLVCSIGCEHR